MTKIPDGTTASRDDPALIEQALRDHEVFAALYRRDESLPPVRRAWLLCSAAALGLPHLDQPDKGGWAMIQQIKLFATLERKSPSQQPGAGTQAGTGQGHGTAWTHRLTKTLSGRLAGIGFSDGRLSFP